MFYNSIFLFFYLLLIFFQQVIFLSNSIVLHLLLFSLVYFDTSLSLVSGEWCCNNHKISIFIVSGIDDLDILEVGPWTRSPISVDIGTFVVPLLTYVLIKPHIKGVTNT